MKTSVDSPGKIHPAAPTLVTSLLAFGLYAVGLLSPLTPSYGKPGTSALLGFWILPMVMLAANALRARSKGARIACEALICLIFFSYLRIAMPLWLAR